MSSPIAAATTHFLRFRIQYSSIALIYYDYMLTFPLEVKYMWRKSFRASTLLYIFCRYALMANVVYLLALAGKLSQGCDHWYRVIAALSVLGRASVIITFTMRTWAVWGRSLWIIAFMGTLGLTCIILDIIHAPGVKCTGGSSIQIVDTLLAILMCIFEFFSAILTTVRCVTELHAAGGFRGASKKSFFFLVLRQGVLYFALVSVFTTAAAILNFRAPRGSFFQRLPNAFTLPVSCTLTARFLLHLRHWDNKSAQSRTAGGHGATSEPTEGTMSDWRAAAASALSMDEFGADPVAAAIQDMNHKAEKRAQKQHRDKDHPDDHHTWHSGVTTMKEKKPEGITKVKTNQSAGCSSASGTETTQVATAV